MSDPHPHREHLTPRAPQRSSGRPARAAGRRVKLTSSLAQCDPFSDVAVRPLMVLTTAEFYGEEVET